MLQTGFRCEVEVLRRSGLGGDGSFTEAAMQGYDAGGAKVTCAILLAWLGGKEQGSACLRRTPPKNYTVFSSTFDSLYNVEQPQL